jgi:hypothetical protein
MGHGGMDFWYCIRAIVGVHVDYDKFKDNTCLGCGTPIPSFNKGRMCNKCFLLLMELTDLRTRLKKNFNSIPSESILKLIKAKLNPAPDDIPKDPAETIEGDKK